jgi:YebC/PmpR family DNA-binding regulatory protein
MRTVIGIDPGLAATGWGVVRFDGSRFTHVGHGVVTTNPGTPLSHRLLKIYEEILYEAYGPGGVALLIDILTDNKNRAAAEIRNLLNKGGGNLGAAGSVAYQFKRKGLINYDASKYKEDDILAVAIDAGAEDVSSDEDSIEVTTSPEDFEKVVKAMEAKGFEHSMAEIARVADQTVTLDKDKTEKALRLVEHLEDHEDVQSVATNLEIPAGFVMSE